MSRLNRREFVQVSTASLLLDGINLFASADGPHIANTATAFVHANAEGKSWTIGNALWKEKSASTPSWVCTPLAGDIR
jgi:hypothetical protein